MGRTYHKGWQSHRPLRPESRRVRWYQGRNDIRLEFMDSTGVYNRHFDGTLAQTQAQDAFDAFVAGLTNVEWMMSRGL